MFISYLPFLSYLSYIQKNYENVSYKLQKQTLKKHEWYMLCGLLKLFFTNFFKKPLKFFKKSLWIYKKKKFEVQCHLRLLKKSLE